MTCEKFATLPRQQTQRNEQRRGKIVGKVQLVGFVVHVIHAQRKPGDSVPGIGYRTSISEWYE
jgi:hypothetical protein